jgi:catechol 2,3-dioxygenase-like lactoylglutathione lyase family enzyme
MPAMPIREFFHLIHVIDDEDEVDAWYEAVFSPQIFQPKGWAPSEKRWASLGAISDMVIEVLQPSSAGEDQGMPLTRFKARFGQHFHSLAWYIDYEDVRPLFRRIREAGIRVAKPGGGMFPEGEIDPGWTIFTHPKDTFGQIEFEGLRPHWQRKDPRLQTSWSADWWRDEHPLGIERSSHVTTVVGDVERARALYVDIFGATFLHEETTPLTHSAFVALGNYTIIELARPTVPDSLLARDLAAHGELPHSCTFKVRDLEAAERHLEKVGVGIADRGGETITLDPPDCYNAVYAFTTRSIPGDRRSGA